MYIYVCVYIILCAKWSTTQQLAHLGSDFPHYNTVLFSFDACMHIAGVFPSSNC